MAHPGGRPTRYKASYCNKLLEMMKKGSSIVQFCAEIGICRDTFYRWAKERSEFSDAYKKGVELSESFWENIGKRGILGLPVSDGKGNEGKINTGMYAFYMKNRFHWTDRTEHVVTADISAGVTEMTPEERQAKIKALLEKQEK